MWDGGNSANISNTGFPDSNIFPRRRRRIERRTTEGKGCDFLPGFFQVSKKYQMNFITISRSKVSKMSKTLIRLLRSINPVTNNPQTSHDSSI